jgi:hypothetical protein
MIEHHKLAYPCRQTATVRADVDDHFGGSRYPISGGVYYCRASDLLSQLVSPSSSHRTANSQ